MTIRPFDQQAADSGVPAYRANGNELLLPVGHEQRAMLGYVGAGGGMADYLRDTRLRREADPEWIDRQKRIAVIMGWPVRETE